MCALESPYKWLPLLEVHFKSTKKPYAVLWSPVLNYFALNIEELVHLYIGLSFIFGAVAKFSYLSL